MNKSPESSPEKICIQTEKHQLQTSYGLCSLLEQQSLVDIAICCNSNVLHAHKTVLAANSPFLREEFEQNPNIEQILLSGLDFVVIRSLIEFMYCGETYIAASQVKYLCAFGRMLHMKILEILCNEANFSDKHISLPPPQFLTKKPQYPAFPFNTPNPHPPCTTRLKPLSYTNLYKPQTKRKILDEAEHQACLKEAQASRRAIANLKKEIGIAPQSNKFIIEDACSETTVENFIPVSSASKLVEMNLNGGDHCTTLPKNFIKMTLAKGAPTLTTEKIKSILGNRSNPNVEIMFKTDDGSFINVNDNVLQNLQKDGLQYQVLNEEGQMSELCKLELLNKGNEEKDLEPRLPEGPIQFLTIPKITVPAKTISPLMIDNEIADLKSEQSFEITEDRLPKAKPMVLDNIKFSPDMFFAESTEKNVLP